MRCFLALSFCFFVSSGCNSVPAEVAGQTTPDEVPVADNPVVDEPVTNEEPVVNEPVVDVPVEIEEPTFVLLHIEAFGPGTVTITPRGTDVGEAIQYESQTIVELSAIADAGFLFEGWMGDLNSADSTITLQLLVDTRLTATFGDPPFIPGDVFSFLSVVETEFLHLMIEQANNEISQWRRDEEQRQSEENSGLGSFGSISARHQCETNVQVVYMKRDATWQVLDEYLGFSRSSIFFNGAADEVDTWNSQQYPCSGCPSLGIFCRS